jgi:cholesterol oxidase
MGQDFDAIVIGSGFGGAIAACRLAEQGMKVLILERGRRWAAEDYPRKPGDAWVFNAREPARQNGWLDLRFFKNMTVTQAAGVGGGSLAYSNVAIEANPFVFTEGWPAEITYDELKPYYDKVAGVMNLQTLPDGQLTQRFRLAREAAEKLGHLDRFEKVPLAVSFSAEWNYQLDRPFDPKHSRTFTNAQGQQQGTCIHLGRCDIGCDVRAKNTLDLNYIPLAEQHGAEVRPLHVVRSVEPHDGGYRVAFDRIEQGRLVRGTETATRVFLAAGSLGSTELLLRCRDEAATLPQLSRLLGHHWSANANFLSMAAYAGEGRVDQTVGPTIASAMDFMDASFRNQRFVIEDDGFPDAMRHSLRAVLQSRDGPASPGRSLLTQIEEHVRDESPLRNVMVWLGAGMDAADGQLVLERRGVKPGARELDLKWRPEQSEGVIEAILEMHRRVTDATGGRVLAPLTWTIFKSLLTIHPLGGCKMGTTPETGVVDHRGQVFGYRDLYVVDGAILPTPIGRNPSHTIAALAERIAALAT